MRRVALGVAAVVALAGCGTSPSSTRITSTKLTVYTGLPLRGERGEEGRAVLRGEKLALNEAGGRVGGLTVSLAAYDDTDPDTGRWAPGQVAANARQAAQNPTAIAYIGDLDSGATAISLPITNETGILQVSPLSGYSGLTQAIDKGEPEKYYPSGQRTFARLVPAGGVEAKALVAWLRARGVGRVALAYDGLQEGLGQAHELEGALQAGGIQIVDIERVDPRAKRVQDVASAARDLAVAPSQTVLYAGGSTTAALAVLRAVHDREPGEELMATDGVADEDLAAGLGSASRQVLLASPLIDVANRPPAAARMARRYRALFGSAPPAAALFGYEAMRGVLDAIKRAGSGGNDRHAVIEAYMRTRARDSVLGPYSIAPDGDTTSTLYGAFRVQSGRLRLVRILGDTAR